MNGCFALNPLGDVNSEFDTVVAESACGGCSIYWGPAVTAEDTGIELAAFLEDEVFTNVAPFCSALLKFEAIDTGASKSMADMIVVITNRLLIAVWFRIIVDKKNPRGVLTAAEKSIPAFSATSPKSQESYLKVPQVLRYVL